MAREEMETRWNLLGDLGTSSLCSRHVCTLFTLSTRNLLRQ